MKYVKIRHEAQERGQDSGSGSETTGTKGFVRILLRILRSRRTVVAKPNAATAVLGLSLSIREDAIMEIKTWATSAFGKALYRKLLSRLEPEAQTSVDFDVRVENDYLLEKLNAKGN